MNKKETLSSQIIVNQALDCLSEQAGFIGKWRRSAKNSIDGGLVLNLPTGKLTFHVEVKKTLRRQQLADVYTRAIDNQPLF